MSAIEQIIDVYVRLGKYKALQDLLDHRQRLVLNITGRDLGNSVLPGEIQREIDAILRGMNKMRLERSASSEASGTGQAEPTE